VLTENKIAAAKSSCRWLQALNLVPRLLMAKDKLTMRSLQFLTATVALALLLPSCDPCKNLDCLSDNYYGQFRIVSATDGRDLVFGPTRIYDKNQISFYSLKGTDTTFFDYQALRFPNTGYDSILHVRFFPKADIAYMRLTNGDVDTLAIAYKTFGTKCCGTITEITNFRFNNAVDIPGIKGTQEIKK
jgi:hypothetical protein